MIVSDGYSLMYDEKQNRIVIGIPPTMETATDTVTPIADRRTDVTETDLMVLLNIAQLMFHKGIRMDAQIGEDKSHPFAESVMMGMDEVQNA